MPPESLPSAGALTAYPAGPVRTEYKLLAKARVEAPSLGIGEIAKAMGYSYQTVLMWLKRRDYQEYESWLIGQQNTTIEPTICLPTPYERRTMHAQINEFAEEMFERLQVIAATTGNEKLQVEIAHDALDRAGFASKRTEQRAAPQFILTAEAMQVLLQREAESRGTVIVGELAEVNHSGLKPNQADGHN